MSSEALALLRVVLDPGLWPIERGVGPTGARDLHCAYVRPERMARWREQLAAIEDAHDAAATTGRVA